MKDKNRKQPSMARRQFIKGSGAGVLMAAGGSVLASPCASATSCNSGKTPYDYDVIVVGGGMAGVTAARDLQKSGYKTLLLEARNRLGGRTFTTQFAGHELELGGSMIHWLQPHIWTEVQRYGIDVHETSLMSPDRTLIKLDNGRVIEPNAEEMMGIAQALNTAMEESQLVWNRPFDSTFTWEEIVKRDHMSAVDRMNQLELTPLQRVALDSLFGFGGAGEAHTVSYNEWMRLWALGNWNYAGFAAAVGLYKIKGGTAGLIRAMVEDGGFEIHLGTPVKRIESRRDHALVTTQYDNQTVSAAAVVSALPINVIGDIEFSPALSKGKQAAYEEKHTGVNGLMFNAEIKGDIGNISGMAASNQPLNYFAVYKRNSEHTILNGAITDYRKLDLQDDRAIEAALREFIPDVEVLSSITYDWVHDPYSRGAYSLYRPGWIKNYFKDIIKPEGRIYFAGSEFTDGWRCFMSGAIGSGIKVAQQINKLLA